MLTSKAFRNLRRVAPLAVLCILAACKSATPPEKLEEAQSLLQEGQTARAVLKLKEITREHSEDPSAITAHIMLAQYYAREANANKALEELEAITADGDFTNPEVVNAMDGIISIRRQIGDHEGALKAMDRIIEVLPESASQQKQLREVERAGILLAWGAEEETKRDEGLKALSSMMLESEDAYARGIAREELANHHRQAGNLEESNAVYASYIEAYPDESIRPRLEMAMGINEKQLGNDEAAEEIFRPAVEATLAEADNEPETAQKTAVLQEVAQMLQLYGDLEKSEEVRRQIMAENPVSRVAIDNQFLIANMWIVAGLQEKNEDYFDHGIMELERIAEDNTGTNIGETAQRAMENAKQVFEQAMNPPAEDDSETGDSTGEEAEGASAETASDTADTESE